MNTIKPSLVISFIAAGMLCIVGSDAAAVEPPRNPVKTKGVNVLIIGHSLTHNLEALKMFAPGVGHSKHKQMLYSHLGAGIAYHYQTETNRWPPVSWRKRYFAPDKKWDALIMSARDAHWKGPQEVSSDEEYAPKFAAEAFKTNPQCQIFIYGNWPTPSESFEKPSFGRTEAHIERVGAAVDKAFPNAPRTRMMPCSLVIRELGRMAERGELPGVTSHFELFSDGDHPSAVAAYAVNALVMSMLYGEPPWNYPSDIYAKGPKGKRQSNARNIQVPEETAAVIKRVVWDILQTYPPAGMPPSLVIANRHLEPVIAGQSYKAELKALNAAGRCAWSIVKGTLPQGLSLSREGVLAGKSAAVGDHPLTIQLTDGKNSSERPLVLTVDQDTPPSIPSQPLRTAALDQYIMQPLKVQGGVGRITWSVSGGNLPYGIMLAPAGALVGSPGESGAFTFTIKAGDSFPGGPRSTERELTWTIGPATPETLGVRPLAVTGKPDDRTVVVDGKLDEPFWTRGQKIARKVKGTPTKQASFDAVWTYRRRGDRKVFGEKLILAFRVLDGPKGKTPRDGIHIFMDGNHDRTLIYSGDDTHFFVPRDHKGGWAQSLRGKVNWFSNARVQEIEGGYTMEISLGGNNYFGGEGNWLRFGPKGVYGLDVAVDEGDDNEVSQQVWRGDANDAEDTSHFGTIVLTGQSAVKPEQPKVSAKEPATNKKGTLAMSGIEILDESFREVLREDSVVRQICDGLQFTEGPVWIAGSKSLLFSDIPADTIYRWTQADGKSVFRRPSHNANGSTLDAKGRLLTCEHGSRTLTRTEASGQVVTIASSYQGRKLNSPNDVVVKSDGTIWFTDPPYGVARGLIEQKANHVFRLDKPGDEPVAVASDFDMPNGLCFSPDEKYLYIADSGARRHIRRLPVEKGNLLGKGEVFAVVSSGVPDGIRADAAGRVYSTAGDGVQVFDTKGKLIGKLRTPQAAANCCFGGVGNKTLFITARAGVFVVELSAAGAR